MISNNKTLDKVYTAQTSTELMDAYKDWAADYDADTVGAFGYVAHIASADALDAVLAGDNGRILDAGCGTFAPGLPVRAASTSSAKMPAAFWAVIPSESHPAGSSMRLPSR